MREVRYHPLWLLTMALIVICLAGAGYAQDEDLPEVSEQSESQQELGAPEDTLFTGKLGESEAKSDTTIRAPVAGRKAKGESMGLGSWWLLDLKPRAGVSVSKEKDVTNWNANVNLNRMLSSKLSVNMGANLSIKENTFLNRSDSNDGTSLSLKYMPVSSVNFTFGYNATVTAHRLDLNAPPAERRKSEGISLAGEINKALTSAITVRVKASGGYSENKSPRVSNTGRDQGISASLNFIPSSALRISATYDGQGRMADSRIDSSGVVLHSSRDRTKSDRVAINAIYNIIDGVRVTMDASQNKGLRQHPDPKRNAQETEKEDGSSASFKCDFNIFKKVTWDLGVNLSQSNKRFVLNKDREFSSKEAKMAGKIKATPWKATTINLNGEYKTGRGEYQTDETGDDVQKSLAVNLSQGLGSKASMSLSALSSLSSIFYDDKEKNPKDRDRLGNSITATLNYRPTENITTGLGWEYSDEKLVYVKAASSASNRTTRKYRASGKYGVNSFLGMKFSQDYDISAIYTDYHFDPSKNNLIRNSNLRSQVSLPITKRTSLSLTHNYKFQDQGGYRREGGHKYYSRSSQTEWHSIEVGLQYRIAENVKFSTRSGYVLQRSWSIQEGKKKLDYENPRSELAGKVDVSYELGANTKMTLKIEQNFQEGKTVNQAFRRYRNINFEVSHVF